MRFGLSTRGLCIAVAVAVFAALIFAAGVYAYFPAHGYVLQLEMASSAEGTAQLFYDRGRGYIEEDSDRERVGGVHRFVVLTFRLPDARCRHLRFDPLEGAGVFEMRNIRVLDGGGNVARTISADHVRALNDIARIEAEGGGVRVETAAGARDPNVELVLDAPVDARSGFRAWPIAGALAVFLLTGVLALAAGWYVERSGLARGALRLVDRVAAGWSNADFIEFDRAAVVFFLGVTVLMLALTAGGIHGSSIAELSATIPGAAPDAPLLGQAKGIRVDDWGCLTPAMLYQLRRADRLSADDSMLGPGKTALLFMLPCRHFTTLFRPQFWGCFVLPEKYAFAAFWQYKNWVLLAGTFLLFKLFARSTWVAIFGVLWFYFSSATQWFFSGPVMPEMVGSMAFLVCGCCYLLIGRSRVRLLVAAVLTAMATVNFAMCLYLPILIPLAWVAVVLIAVFALAKRKVVVAAFFKPERLLAVGVWAGLSVTALLWFYVDARSTIAALSNTIYPGHRVVGGGGVTLAQLASQAMNLWETEKHFPSVFANVCAAAGFFWLAPVAMVLAGKLGIRRPIGLPQWSFMFLSALFVGFLLWIVAPIPAEFGVLFFNRVTPKRCQYVLGLVNVLLVVVYLAAMPGKVRRWSWERVAAECGGYAGVLIVVAAILWITNVAVGHFLTRMELACASLLFAGMVFCVIRTYRLALAGLVLLPLIGANGLINPLDRGLHLLDHGELHQVARRTELRQGKWLVFGDNDAAADFFAANGFEVLNSRKYVPDLRALRVLDPQQEYVGVYNQTAYNIARPIAAGGAPSFFFKAYYVVQWSLSPVDPRLRELGVRYEAFDHRPDEKLVPAGSMQLLYDHPVDGFWLYGLKEGESIQAAATSP